MRAQTSQSEPPALAIVGYAFEFPQDATSSEKFWQMICEGRSASTEFPEDRLNIQSFYHPDESRQNALSVRGGNFVREDIGAFDAPFFSISPAEACCMDPQHRRILETAYLALEDAGIPLEKCVGSDTSVYTGCFTNDYLSILQQDFEADQKHAAMGIAPSMLANRVSWFFNFKGTSMNLDSACSSSLVALHLACRDLLSGSASMSLVGGANLVFHPNFMKIMASFNFLSPDSRSWSFDERANGYARGDGSAMMVVKRLDDALRDGDTIRAVIRNTGTNQDGRTPGITQPDMRAQVNLIKRTYREAALDMSPTRFFEAHGTGTPVGDPVEANAIGEAFQGYRSVEDPLYIGAVKANIGHLEGASGMAGLIKALLVLEKGIIPPIAGLESLNSRIDEDKLCLRFPREVVPWPTTGLRRACVNSFGFGGTNATVILDDAFHYLEQHSRKDYSLTQPSHGDLSSSLGITIDSRSKHIEHTRILKGPEEPKYGHEAGDTKSFPTPPMVLVLSASDERSCQEMLSRYQEYIAKNPTVIKSLAYTLAEKRSLFAYRSFILATEFGSELEISPPVKAKTLQRLAFVFTGQGSQYAGMGCELRSFPKFRETLNLLQNDLEELGANWCIEEFLDVDSSMQSAPIDDPQYSQPLTTCLQICLIDLIRSFGVRPTIVLGHSSGEIAAAYAIGAVSRFSAVKIAYYRGLLSSQLASAKSGLSMMAVGLSSQEVVPYLDRLAAQFGEPEVFVGCINSPKSITLSGNVDQLAVLRGWLEGEGVFARQLRVPIAYHSPVMQEISDQYRCLIQDLEPGNAMDLTPAPMMSSVTKDIVAPETLRKAEYWVQNLTSPVQFEGALAKIQAQAKKAPRKQLGRRGPAQNLSVSHILEIGPHNTLQGPIVDILKVSSHISKKIPSYIPSLRRKYDATQALLLAIGKLHSEGYKMALREVNQLGETSPAMLSGLPPYPFNHSQIYWRETRLGRNFRFREAPRHDLLGTRNVDWNPHMAQWRNVVRITELPWLRDHMVDGEILFPATGMLAMAIEAFRQINSAKDLLSIHLRDVKFSRPFRFPGGTEEVETQLFLSSGEDPSNDSDWSRFRLFTLEEGTHVECSAGFIRGDFSQEAEIPKTPFISEEAIQTVVTNAVTHSKSAYDPYSEPMGNGLQYGPCFQVLDDMHLGGDGRGCAKLHSQNEALATANLKSHSRERYTIHPCTMDGLAQLIVPSLGHGRDPLPTMVPVSVSKIWINCQNVPVSGEKLLGAVKCSLRGRRGAKANLAGTTLDSSTPLIYFENLETSFLGGLSSDEATKDRQNLFTSLKFKPDIDMMSHDQLVAEISRDRPKDLDHPVSQHQDLMTVLLCFIEEVTIYLEGHPSTPVPEYLVPYLSWMTYQLHLSQNQVFREASKRLLNRHEERELLNLKVEASGNSGKFFVHVGRNLLSVLSGSADPLDIIFRDGLADLHYEQALGNPHYSHPAAVFIDLLSFKSPSMNILEAGAGTGGQTLRALQTLSPKTSGFSKCVRYDYTDISPGFFPRAKEKFQEYSSIMDFRVLDISKDVESQSFHPESYDLILASHVLHATDNLDYSLRNVRKLLKPGGKLLLFETTHPDALQIGFPFGLLKGWWDPLRHERRSAHSPCIPSPQWHQKLQDAGFSGIDVEIPGQEHHECRSSSIMVSTAVAPEKKIPSNTDETAKLDSEIFLLRDSESPYQCAFADSVGAKHSVTCLTLEEMTSFDIPKSSTVIFLLEMQQHLLYDISSANFALLKNVLNRAKNVLWISEPKEPKQLPNQSLVEGLGRSLASEDSRLKFVTLKLDGSEGRNQAIGYVSTIVQKIQTTAVRDLETNYYSQNGALHISRVSENRMMKDMVSGIIKPRQQIERELNESIHASVSVQPGLIETVGYIEDEPDLPVPEADEILVAVKAIGLTHRDYLIASGEMDEQSIGTECAGVVLESESPAFQPGDHVFLIGADLARTHVRVKAAAAALMPTGMTFAEAASLPTSLWLAQISLKRAMLDEGEWILVQQASSSVGQILLRLAIEQGSRVLATVSSDSKKEALCKQHNLTESVVFVDSDPQFLRKIETLTGGQGIDVIVGSLAAWKGPDLSSCLAANARLIDIGLTGDSTPSDSFSETRYANISRSAVDLVELLQQKPALVYRSFQQAVNLWFKLQVKDPRSVNIFAAGAIKTPFQQYQERQMTGKSIIELAEGAPIKINCSTKARYQFPKDASYVIAGGLGGLGRSFARWLVSRGACHLILLSRSGPKTRAAQDLVRELEEKGVIVATPQVDIANLPDLKQALQRLSQVMPPVKGCIQATMALRDSFFENMTHEDWSISTAAKVKGSWNLHEVIQDVDFFVFISSINGILGNRAQANYASGNVFEDYLAHYRISQGLKAASIDLGMMVTEGAVAENESLLTFMRRDGHLTEIKQEELIALLDFYCNPELPLLTDGQHQVLVGIEMPSVIAAKGIDLHHIFRRPMFSHLFRMDVGTASTTSMAIQPATGAINRPVMLKAACSFEDATALVAEWITHKIAHILGLQASSIDPEKPIHAYGIDSLVAVDMKNWFENELGASITVFDLMGNISLERLSALVVQKSRHCEDW